MSPTLDVSLTMFVIPCKDFFKINNKLVKINLTFKIYSVAITKTYLMIFHTNLIIHDIISLLLCTDAKHTKLFSMIDIDFMHYAIEEWASKSKYATAHQQQPRGGCRVLDSGCTKSTLG